ncbi:MAG: DNRLRE domain-containing protein, partial [Armatimonadota bacterium]|nr:DNRLRE domain-containing protein [Armatimonadota bacterium]
MIFQGSFWRRLRALSALAAAFLAWGCPATAEQVTLTLQRGLEGYRGVEDTFLYAPSSVADVNYGAAEGLNAGINRWKEHYVALIRFRLNDIPPAARVVRASLWLYSATNEFPTRDLVVNAQAIAPANADWVEGNGDGTRTPTPNAACWNARRYGTARWAGQSGLREAGVDTVGDPVASATLPKEHAGWLELPLNTAVVQEWIRQPAANAGLRLFPLAASMAGDIAYFRSSDYAADPALRPKLVLQLELNPADAQALRRTRLLRTLGEVEALVETARTAIAAAGNPARAVAALAKSATWV